MILSEMMTQVRLRGLDPRSIAWADADVRRELNNGANRVARLLGRHGRLNFIQSTTTFTTATDTAAYELTPTDIRRIYKIRRTDTTPDQIVEVMDPTQEFNEANNAPGRAWKVFLTRDKDTLKYTVNFAYDPPSGMTFTVYYIVNTIDLATDGSDDASSYTEIPTEYHDLVVQEAVAALTGPDGSDQGNIQRLGELRDDMMRELAEPVTADEILDEWR